MVIQSCSSLKTATLESETAYQEGNYEKALTILEPIIKDKESKGREAKAPAYVGAGKAALALNQNEKAQKYLETAYNQQYASAELYALLAEAYKRIDNLSKEIRFLEYYYDKYPQGKEIEVVKAWLFKTYVESENWNLAYELWPEIEQSAKEKIDLLEGYLLVNKNLGDEQKCRKLAADILKRETKNIVALEWYAQHFYWDAENTYVTEMKAYKNNRTTSQYKKLLKILDHVYDDFRTSRDYYLTLYKMEPKAEYAEYLANIYTRLNDKQKAAYYKNRAR